LFPTKNNNAVNIFEPEVSSLGCKELTLLEFYGIAVTVTVVTVTVSAFPGDLLGLLF
jgi:hypothetical protein